MIPLALRNEWEALLASRRKNNASGQDGSDFALWLQSRLPRVDPVQLEMFP